MSQEIVGRYQILRELGRGGMATVFLAHDPRFSRDVAVKVLPTYFQHETDFTARFEREAKTMASLEHTAIVPVYDYGKAESPFLVMRYMKGGTLKNKLDGGPLSQEEIILIMERIGDALDSAHARGVIHRDLKPDNVLFDEYGRAYLSDFGIAKLAESSTAFTKTGGLVGTPAYMSPEQASGMKDIDQRSDLYTLGVILYEMLTGKAPFNADTPVGLILKHISEPIPPVLDNNPALPSGCEVVIRRAMAKQPEARYASATAMVSDLKAAYAGTLVLKDDEKTLQDIAPPGPATLAGLSAAHGAEKPPAGPPSGPPPPAAAGAASAGAEPPAPAVVPATRPPRAGSRTPLIIAGLVILALVLLGVGYLVFGRGGGDDAALAATSGTETAVAQIALMTTQTAAAGDAATETAVAATEAALAAAATATEEAIIQLTQNAPPTATPTDVPTPAPTPIGGGGGLIAFDSDRDETDPPADSPRRRDIYLITSDGFQQVRLPGDIETDGDPDWSPDGSQIVFESRRDGNPEIYIMDADGRNPRRLTNDEANDWSPVWSPDGTRIAFASTRTGVGEIFTMNPDGSDVVQVTALLTSDAIFPAWSPDGTRIAFEALVRARVREIFVVEATGENLTQITDTGDLNRYPSWSPDGSRLAFATNRDGNFEIYTMNSDGSDAVRVTNDAAVDWTPVWSPDGTRLAYVSQRDGNGEVYVANIDGSDAVNITNHPGEDQYPSWQPPADAAP